MALLVTVVRRALKAVPLTPADAATHDLVVHYAAMIDDARPQAKFRKSLDALYLAAKQADDPHAVDDFHKVADALALQTTISDLGPKLLAALESLGMTPRARRALVREASASGIRSPLDELDERRQARNTG